MEQSDVSTAGKVRWRHNYARDVPELVAPTAAPVLSMPQAIQVNRQLATALGLDLELFAGPETLSAFLAGDGQSVAMAYAGHQFGGYSPRLGDGRALLLGELTDKVVDVHLKGSGLTPFSRGGDGQAALGAMLREYVVSEAMHALGLPTTRSLAVIATGEQIVRDIPRPAAILARVASSHLRIGTFEYAAQLGRPDVLVRLADHALARHYPHVAAASNPYLALLEAVVRSQADLVAAWMSVGFIHGVMNTDNVAISGETIDYGPCAFLDEYDVTTVFSSVDREGRYAYGNQPSIGQWNLVRFAETLLPLLGGDQAAAVEAATAALNLYAETYRVSATSRMLAKLGLDETPPDDPLLVQDLLGLMAEHRADFTSTFIDLARSLENQGDARPDLWRDDRLTAWLARWRSALTSAGEPLASAANQMRQVNPLYIPRNHLLEEALGAAEQGSLQEVQDLIAAVTDPFGHRDHPTHFAAPPPAGFTSRHRTFCGT